MHAVKSLRCVVLALSLGCNPQDTVRRANDEDQAIQNCAVIQQLSDELCTPDDQVLVVDCISVNRIRVGLQPYPAAATDCSTFSCDAALDVAALQCESFSMAKFGRWNGYGGMDPTCCDGLDEDCLVGVSCY